MTTYNNNPSWNELMTNNGDVFFGQRKKRKNVERIEVMNVNLIYVDRVYFPQMCSMKTEAMNNNDITRTGTGPLKKRKEKILLYQLNVDKLYSPKFACDHLRISI